MTVDEIYSIIDARNRINRAYRRSIGSPWEVLVGELEVRSANVITQIAGLMDSRITKNEEGELRTMVEDTVFVYRGRAY